MSDYDFEYFVMLLATMMLVWYLIKTCKYREGMKLKPVNNLTDTQYKFGPLPKGEIGDVTVYFNETRDNMFADQWRTIDGGLYVHNSKTFWKDVNTPNEASYWMSTGQL